MLNKSQYKVLKKMIEQLNNKHSEFGIIGNWGIGEFDLTLNEKNYLKTVIQTPINNDFGGLFRNGQLRHYLFCLDEYIIEQMNEYEDKHRFSKKTTIILTMLGTIFGIIIGALTIYTFFK
jgi:hypothetical protein